MTQHPTRASPGSTSVTGQLLVFLLPLVAFSMLLVFALLEISFYRTQVAAVERSLGGLLEVQEAAASNALWEVDDEQLEVVVSNLAAYPNVESVTVTDERGRQRAKAGNLEHEPKSSTLVGMRKLVHDGLAMGELRIELHLRTVTAQVIDHLPKDALVLLTVLLALVLGVVMASRRVIQRPLALLADGIDKARQSTGGEPIPWQSDDELGRVVHAFNELQATWTAAEAEVAYMEEHLRELIQIRTHELERALKAAESATNAKSAFLATMSHEIRTPMNGVLGMAQLLLMPDISEQERQEYARVILNSGQTLLTLLNDILDLSKVEAGKLELLHAACDPRQIVDQTVALFAEPAQSKGLRMETTRRGATSQRYWADPIRLRQMLSNLISNAIKFTSHGFVRVEVVEVERRHRKALLEFSVADSGVGIPPEKQSLLFKPFSQADSSTTRDFGGTGLGLSIVRSMAKLMSGEAGVESEPGKGSRFWFRIWSDILDEGEESRHLERGTQFERNSRAAAGLTGRVLVVEDNPTNRMVIEAVLGKLGIRVDCVENGQEAVAAITQGTKPDLVLMDCEMPVMDGFEATRMIRRWEQLNARPRVTIIALTAGAFEDDRKRCLDAGMDDFLTKPIVVEKLTAALARRLSVGDGRTASPPTAATARRQDGPPVFDDQRLLSQLGGNHELAKTVIASATRDMASSLDRLEQAIAAGNRADAQRETHTLKGLSAQLGGVKLSKHLVEVYDHLKRGVETDGINTSNLRSEYQLLAAALGHWMTARANPATIPGMKPMSLPQIVALYHEIEELLAQNKFDALGRFKDLQEALAGTAVSAEISAIGGLVAELRFDLALAQLRQLAAAQGWEDKS